MVVGDPANVFRQGLVQQALGDWLEPLMCNFVTILFFFKEHFPQKIQLCGLLPMSYFHQRSPDLMQVVLQHYSV